MKHRKQRSFQGFTLVEILVVLAIIAILAAIIFPAFTRAKESAREASCASNLHKIGMAVQLYFSDEKRYPGSLAALLPADHALSNSASPVPTPVANVNPTTGVGGTGYLKISDLSFQCPDDPAEVPYPRSSYGDISTDITTGPADPARLVWNYWGYQADGTAYPTYTAASAAAPSAALLVDPGSTFNPWATPPNPIKNSLSNRFAPATTIVTHCIYHRIQTAANLQDPSALYTTPANDAHARDIILRLDGSTKTVDVSQFKTNGYWQTQNF
ncbi:MAG: prepilin-type N-terminal cleavage/methylation domain-containing protein [Abitibacteriaceae bacterium]|nr:prepilin-type N-terminal cleavage/methylation domain-containing protein [Abditibacteriaceae bacterium]MBV9867894.1 prepilin-type N-terminal cleavage/methylation domain-containing protein [Abditibacteriaceae bacterium]